MAIYHFSAKVIGRSAGRSAVASAAYRAAELLHDEKLDQDYDYTAKAGVVHSEIMLPSGAPGRWLDRETLWNEVEAGEKRKDAQLARDIEISLPRELGRAEAIKLARDFVQEQFVDRGMVADLNVHWTMAADGALQPHAHVMLTMRRIETKIGAVGERGHDREADRFGHSRGGAGRPRSVAQNPAVDGDAGDRSDRDDRNVAAEHPEHPGAHLDPAGHHRAADHFRRVIAAVGLKLGLEKRATGKKAEEAIGFGPKEVAWNDRGLLSQWRERWGEMANSRLAELGHDVRIDHRCYVAQGIELVPQNKIGPAGARREERGEYAERAAEHRAIARGNGEKLLAEPEIALRALTQQHSTFTRQALARFVNRHTDGAEQFADVMARVEASPELLKLGRDGRDQERLTTREMVQTEARMERAAAAMAGRDAHRVGAGMVEQAAVIAARGGLTLGAEQRAALEHVTGGADVALVVGYAGTGKSAMFSVARAAWAQSGYRVQGVALSGIAAEGFEAGSGIASRTIASLEFAWGQERDQLTDRDVLVMDEAGMVGSRQMERVLSAARDAGAKVVLIGDPEQLQAIEAGAAFRALAERHGAAEITEVRRQRQGWQRDATRDLALGFTSQALAQYEIHGMVKAAPTREAAKVALVAGWDAARRAQPAESRVILAYTRDDVRDLNTLARAQMRAAGELQGADQAVQTERGTRDFAGGDRIMFLRNERGLGAAAPGRSGGRDGVAVKNGTLGTVLEVAAMGERLTVRLDRAGADGAVGEVVTFDVREYGHVDHGYAATVHKAQGVTVDRAHVLATPMMDRHAAYVGLTRHRDGVALHYGADDFAGAGKLAWVLGRERAKDTTLDYGIGQGGADLEAATVRRYAERRGLDPLRPESAIVVQQREAPIATPEPARAASVPKRSKFGGLKLGAGQKPAGAVEPVVGQEERKAVAPVVPSGAVEINEQTMAEVAKRERLLRGVAAYATALADAARMAGAGLPVLAHQAEALTRSEADLEGLKTGLAGDVRAVLKRAPTLAQAVGTREGVETLGAAVGSELQGRLALEQRGRAAVKQWGELERVYDAAAKAGQQVEQRQVGGQLEAFAKTLKQDVPLDGLLRERGRELGVTAGSWLDRVARAGEVELRQWERANVDQALRPRPTMSRGPSMGM